MGPGLSGRQSYGDGWRDICQHALPCLATQADYHRGEHFRHHSAYHACPTCSLTLISAFLGYAAWHFHVCRASSLQLVPQRDLHLTQRVLVSPQRHRLDQEQAVPASMGQRLLHLNCYTCSALLGFGDRGKLVGISICCLGMNKTNIMPQPLF